MQYLKAVVLVTAALAVQFVLTGCGGKSADAVPPRLRTGSDFEFTVVDETYVFDGATAGFKCTQSDSGDVIELQIAVEDAHNLKALMCELRYDPLEYDPQPVECTGALDPTGGEVISQTFALDTNPGYICYGQILPQLQSREGFTGDATLAIARFLKQPDHASKAALAVTNRRSQTTLAWDPENSKLSWFYYCSGDFNQDGYVGVADLTPMGIHWREYSGGGPFPDSDDASVVDYDSNGEINGADAQGIVRNFNESVWGYSIFTSQNIEDYPESASDPNGPGAIELDFVDLLIDAIYIPDHARKYFEFTIDEPQSDAYYWVRLGGDGIASNHVGGPE